jgi:geranylgeranyl diphosphate synthase type II
MSKDPQIERHLAQTIGWASGHGGPPRLGRAVHHAVFPGGARVRPRLCLAVARACGAGKSPAALAAAVAVELLHCASLVHDDLPCFDDADLRRGRPTVHRIYGERLAVLAGDALIVLALQVVTQERAATAAQRLEIIGLLAAAAGMPHGIAAGQAWECESRAPLSRYHRAKTGAMFAVAMAAGAVASDADPAPWREAGECLGEAYQIADDLDDVHGHADRLGKPANRDAELGVPNAVLLMGEAEARRRFQELVEQSVAVLPRETDNSEVRGTILALARRIATGTRARPAA